MATAAPTIEVIRAQISAIRNKIPSARVFGIISPMRWSGQTVQGAGEKQIAVYQCDSPLQMRLALQNAPASASATVLVTPLDDSKVSDDIRVRLASRKLYPLNSWEIVRDLFKGKFLDPRITRHVAIADWLLEHAGTCVFPPVAGGTIDAETVWDILLKERLGLSGSHADAAELLRATAECDFAPRWKNCTAEFRQAAAEWIKSVAGDVAGAILTCLNGDHGSDALAAGLVMGVVYEDSVGGSLDKAVGRLEAYVGNTNLQPTVARRWRDAAVAAMGRLSKLAIRTTLDQAEALLTNIGAQSQAWRSDILESSFEQRLSRLALALVGHIDARATVLSAELRKSLELLKGHRSWQDRERRCVRVLMALRLARWLAEQSAADAGRTAPLHECARAYAATGGYVDWARQTLRGGEPNKDLANAYVRLVDAATEVRESENRKFARALVEERAQGRATAELINIEEILNQVVTKAAEAVPVLMLLIDGMSWAVFRELAEDIQAHDWNEIGFEDAHDRLMGLVALPSVTEVCRTSLMCGTLRRGKAFDEAQGFAAHPGLVRVSGAGEIPKLFHKAALEGDEDSSLAGDIRIALQNPKQQVVGIVINAVDDHLEKGDQVDAIWSMQHIRVLEPILKEASDAGRLVILASDHGHVIDRQTESREVTDGHRWRRPGAPVTDGEVEVVSPRVVMPEGNRVVLPWSERLRYGSKKNGYHGGATPQELLVPISMIWSETSVPKGFQALLPDAPAWWNEIFEFAPAIAPAPVPAIAKTTRESPAKTLFDEPAAPLPVAKKATEPWIAALLQCAIYQQQKKAAGRTRIDDEDVRKLLTALSSRNGSMLAPALANAISVPEHRLFGLLATMQRLLNVEGYPVLDRQDASNTILLNTQLLMSQFEIKS